jgi:hypothetical protein
MTTLLVFDDSDAARDGLRAVCAEAAPGDRLVIMAPVIVPASLPVNLPAGDIWRPVCRAEVRLHHACALADALSADATRCVFARIHARDLASAVAHGANRYHADTILLARPTVFWRRFSLRHRTIPAILQSAPCSIRILDGARPGEDGPGWPTQPARNAATVPALSRLHPRLSREDQTGAGAQVIAIKERHHAS